MVPEFVFLIFSQRILRFGLKGLKKIKYSEENVAVNFNI